MSDVFSKGDIVKLLVNGYDCKVMIIDRPPEFVDYYRVYIVEVGSNIMLDAHSKPMVGKTINVFPNNVKPLDHVFTREEMYQAGKDAAAKKEEDV